MDMAIQSTEYVVLGFERHPSRFYAVRCTSGGAREGGRGGEGRHGDRQICRVLYTGTSLVREQNTPSRPTNSCVVRTESTPVLHWGYPVRLSISSLLSNLPSTGPCLPNCKPRSIPRNPASSIHPSIAHHVSHPHTFTHPPSQPSSSCAPPPTNSASSHTPSQSPPPSAASSARPRCSCVLVPTPPSRV
jgi:hypothetical protein